MLGLSYATPGRHTDEAEIPVLVAALGPRLLRVAGQHAAGTITWMATAAAVEQHVAPRIRKAAADAAHDDVGEARAVAAQVEALFAAGATDVWAAPFPVGDDRSASRARPRARLKDLVAG